MGRVVGFNWIEDDEPIRIDADLIIPMRVDCDGSMFGDAVLASPERTQAMFLIAYRLLIEKHDNVHRSCTDHKLFWQHGMPELSWAVAYRPTDFGDIVF